MKVQDLLKDSDFVDNWHSLFVAFGMQSAEEVAARYDMAVPDGSVILDWIRSQEKKQSTLVNQTTADDISKILAESRANGESIPDMVAKTKQYFDGIAYRAEKVARTNVIACNNAAAQDVYAENGVRQHEWLSTDDDRVRDEHAAVDGQVRNIDEPFDVGGEQLMYPGDSNGSAGNVINCRCTILPVIDAVPNTPRPDEPEPEPTPEPEPVNVPQSFVDDLDRLEERVGITLPDEQRSQLERMAAQMGDKAPPITLGGRGAHYDPSNNTIQIGKAFLKGDQNTTEALIHEMTHAIQSNVLYPQMQSDATVKGLWDNLVSSANKVTREISGRNRLNVVDWLKAHSVDVGLASDFRLNREALACISDLYPQGKSVAYYGHNIANLTGKLSGLERRASEVMAEYVAGQGEAIMPALKAMDELKDLFKALDAVVAVSGG